MMRRVIAWGLRVGFRLLYNELAWIYDGVSRLVSWGEWRSWQRTALPYLTGPRVLELGFGTGDLLCDLGETRHQVWGLELSRQMVRIARGKLRRRGLGHSLVRGRAQALPLASNTFDSLAVTFPSPFILHPRTLEEIHRVLRTRGRLVVVPVAYPRRQGPVGWLFDLLYAVTGQTASPAWGELLEAAGLRASEEEVQLPHSRAQIVVAVKVEQTARLPI